MIGKIERRMVIRMPTYDYKCYHCNNIEEHFHGMLSEIVALCPKCNHEMVKMIGKGSGVHFKGSGFHVNDYPKKGQE